MKEDCRAMAAHPGIEPTFDTSQIRAIPVGICGSQRVSAFLPQERFSQVAQIYEVLVSEFVRKRFSPPQGRPSERRVTFKR